ncbi:MAG: hypothetical protein OEV31_04645, partial [Gammaproteobacteria bacterium]|nr:hypothetical protein [Gammaproteobacteria bacterium]
MRAARSITRQAAWRLFASLGLFVILVALSTGMLYRLAWEKAGAERTEDLATFFQTRLAQLDQEWELYSRDVRLRIEHTRILEQPATATLNLQAYLTIQSGDRRYRHLQILDPKHRELFYFGPSADRMSVPPPTLQSG